MNKSSSAIFIKGTSGSGKSTRVYLFLEYLESIGIIFEPFMWKHPEDGKVRQVGLVSEDMGIVFLGKWYENGGVRRWQGLDSVTSKIGKSKDLSEFLLHCSNLNLSVLVEGAGTTASWRFRPKYLYEVSHIGNILQIRYDYSEDELHEYEKRIKYRSGKLPKGDSMWRKRHTFGSDYKKAVTEAVEVNNQGGKVVLYSQPHTSPLYDLGVRVFEFFGIPELCEPFIDFCKDSDYIKKNSYKNFENGK